MTREFVATERHALRAASDMARARRVSQITAFAQRLAQGNMNVTSAPLSDNGFDSIVDAKVAQLA